MASWHRKNTKETKRVDIQNPEIDVLQYQNKNFIIPCYVFGKQVSALKDSGSQITLIDESILEPDQKPIKTVPVKSVFGEIKALNVVEIEISSPHFNTNGTLKIEAGLTRALNPPLLLGNDIFAKYPGIFNRRESDAANNNKIINSSRSDTPASRAEVEAAETRAGARAAAAESAASDAVNINKFIISSRTNTPASKAEVEPTKESSEIETHAVASPAAAAAAAADATAGTATGSKITIYDADIATRARNYDPASIIYPCEDSSDGSLQRSVSAGDARIIDAYVDSNQINSSSAETTRTHDTSRRTRNKTNRPKNVGSETSVRRDHETKSDTDKHETVQKPRTDMNTAQECTDAGVKLKKPDERGKTRMSEDKNKLTSDPIIASDGKVMNFEQFKAQQMQDVSLAEIWEKGRVGHPRFFISDKGILFSKVENAGWEGYATGNVLVAPMACREQILHLAHSHLLGGHLGINKTRDRIRRQFWFPKFDQIISQYVNSCPNVR